MRHSLGLMSLAALHKARSMMNALKCATLALAVALSAVPSVVAATNTFNLLRQAAYGGTGFDFPEDIVALTNGGWLVACTSASSPGTSKSAPAREDEDFWLLKLNADLSKAWDVSFGGNAQDRLFALAATDDGGAILAGRSASAVSGTKTTANYQLQSSPGLSAWTSFGAPFLAQSNLVSQYADADTNTRFWRLVKLP
jgi:hypothetical protein